MNNCGGYGGYIFDLDGTIYRGDSLLPGAAELLEQLDGLKREVVFLSNKPIATREDYAQKLRGLGVEVESEQVINSSYVMAHYMRENHPQAKVYVIGEPPLIGELREAGLTVTEDPAEIEYVIASFDRNFHYDKLNIALQAIKKGAGFLATNPDRTCPVAGGEVPDAAGTIAAVEAVTEKEVEIVVGKPSRHMLEAALDQLGLPAEECLLAGDRAETDIKMGKDYGLDTALVLTGVTDRESLGKLAVQPDFVLENIGQVRELC